MNDTVIDIENRILRHLGVSFYDEDSIYRFLNDNTVDMQTLIDYPSMLDLVLQEREIQI